MTSPDPEPNRPDHAAAFFFLGAFEPAELAKFNVQNFPLPGGGIFEAYGHGAGVWWRSKFRRDVEDVREASRDWLETIAAAYFLSSGVALGVRLAHWVETLVPVEEAVLGFIDSRFRVIAASAEGEPHNAALRRAVDHAAALRGRVHIQPAVKEAWRSALDPSDEAFLSAFRALECLRRLYGEGESERKAAWQAMQTDLNADLALYDVLGNAAKSVRHGNRPASPAEVHPINTARRRRRELLDYATGLVRTKVGKELGVDLLADSPKDGGTT